MADNMDPDFTPESTPTADIVEPVRFRKFDDIDQQRKDIYDSAAKAFQGKKLENATHRLELNNVGYDNDFNPSIADEKKAILQNGTIQRPLKGTISLYDSATNNKLDEQRITLAHIPHLTGRGLFIRDGVPWALRNQIRLRPGIYARKKSSGSSEAHFNIKPGTGRGFRVELDPESGVFKMMIGQSGTRLYPILKAAGVTDEDMKKSWGEDLFKRNYRLNSGHDLQDVTKIIHKLGREELEVKEDNAGPLLKELLAKSEVDEGSTELTLGEKIKNISPATILKASQKVIKVSKDEDPGDNRDSQAFQSFHSAEDFIHERLKHDQTGALRTLLWRASREGNLSKAKQGGLLNKNIDAIFNGSGLSHQPESINDFELNDLRQAVTRLGEGGMNLEAASKEARDVQTSYLGLIDPIRAPESSKMGLDIRVADGAVKGSDNQLYGRFINLKTGKEELLGAKDVLKKVVTFPGEMDSPNKRVPAIKNDKFTYVNKDEVDYVVPSAQAMFSSSTNMIPFPEGIKGQRALMGARFSLQALPLHEAEAPLVQTANEDGSSMHKLMGKTLGAKYSEHVGVVRNVTPDSIEIDTKEGKKTVPLYNNYPNNRKTGLHNTPMVKPGQIVMPGMLLAKSNLTDDKGTAAIGKNLRVAYMSAEGNSIEDGIPVSESAAKKMTSEHFYEHELDTKDIKSTKTADFNALFPQKYTNEQLSNLGEDGIIKEGTVVKQGDPLLVAYGEKPKRGVGVLMETAKNAFSDKSQVWDHSSPGVVTDIVHTRNGINVIVKSYDSLKVGDKLSNRKGFKGIVSEIRPDEQMPVDEDGNHVEMIMNALGTVSRHNPSAIAESLLGKIASKTGKPYVVKSFSTPEGIMDFAVNEADKHGIKTQEDLTDPRDNRKIKNIFTGNSYIMKLHHSVEGKLSSRANDVYSVDDLPAKGPAGQAKRVGLLDLGVLLSSGATDFIKDYKLIRGQRNDDYWRAVRNGETPIEPDKSIANEQFKSQLKAAGVNVREKGKIQQLAPMLDEDVDKMAAHEITNAKTFDYDSMEPIEGGLFDIAATGGANGTKWSKINLPEKIPHPLFEEPIRKLLNVTGKKYEEILSGKAEYFGKTGPAAIADGLKNVNIDREIEAAKAAIRSNKKTLRDDAVKRLNYLTGIKKLEIKPEDLMISKIPVLPAKFRPVVVSGNTDMIHDMNYLYHDLMESKDNYIQTKSRFGDAGEQLLTMYNAVKAVAGVGEPVNPKTAEQGVKGMLRYAIGIGETPKAAFYQRKTLGTTVDTVGRSTIVPDKDLDIDHVGVPERMAWDIFKPYIIRRLVQSGMPASDAVLAVRDKTNTARNAMDEEVKVRPVVWNRAPALHKFNYVGGWAKIRKDDAIGVPYPTLPMIAGDFDGDNINIHVPSTYDAIQDIIHKLMPSKTLISPASYDVHIKPFQDYLAGLYLASTPNKKENIVIFKTKDEAIKAYHRGDITARTPIRILQS